MTKLIYGSMRPRHANSYSNHHSDLLKAEKIFRVLYRTTIIKHLGKAEEWMFFRLPQLCRPALHTEERELAEASKHGMGPAFSQCRHSSPKEMKPRYVFQQRRSRVLRCPDGSDCDTGARWRRRLLSQPPPLAASTVYRRSTSPKSSAAHLIGRRAAGPDGGFCHVAYRPLHVIGERLSTCSKCGPDDLQRRQVPTNPDHSGCIISDSAEDRPVAGLDVGPSTF